jgi:hypothetical protein
MQMVGARQIIFGVALLAGIDSDIAKPFQQSAVDAPHAISTVGAFSHSV